MEKKDNRILVGILMGLVISLFVVVGLFVMGIINFKLIATDEEHQNDTSENIKEDNILSQDEAVKLGRELYDKATEVYETWQLLPYCGVSVHEIQNKEIVDFGKASKMYESEFKNMNELKDYLATFLSDEIINQHINEEAITDLSILDQDYKEYTNYVISSDKLFCRVNTGKGWLSRYLDNYEITTNTIKNDIIIYNVKLANVTEAVAMEVDSKCTYGSKITDCNANQIEYVETKFIIKKINSNWIVTDYTLHD